MGHRVSMLREQGEVPFLTFARPARVLLADCEDERRENLAAALQQEGYEVEEVSSGVELRAMLLGSARAADPFDLVIANLDLPGMVALDALERSSRLAGVTPVFILIARRVEDCVHLEAQRLGAVIFDHWFDVADVRDCAVSLVSPVKPHARA